ncbi:MAG: PepSY domain-containing protein [Planctomycetota bacterium]
MNRSSQLYRMVWRWHFYAGLITAPIIILLGITGAIYLFRPIAEPWLYSDMWYVDMASTAENTEESSRLVECIRAAEQSMPDGTASTLEWYPSSNRACVVTVRDQARNQHLLFVDPSSGEVQGTLVRDSMLMRQVRNLHGELMMGWFGSAIVETTACWTLVLTATGICLWWPRGRSKIWGVLLPRLRRNGRTFWKDVHSVTAFWSAGLVIVLIVTGLPWTNVWGGALARLQNVTGQSAPPSASRRPILKSGESAGRTPIPTDRAVDIARSLGLDGAFTLSLPKGDRGTYGFRSQPVSLSESHFLHLDQYSGEVIDSAKWGDLPILARAKTMGIRLHQGELLGTSNFVAMLLATLSLPLSAIAAIVMWWRRRPAGRLAAPPRPNDWTPPKWLGGLTACFCVFFPMLFVSWLSIGLIDWMLMKRWAD